MEQSNFLFQLAFWFFALTMVGGALGVVFARSIVYSALSLLVTFMAIAGVFGLLNAPFLAGAQILVYGVGLTIIMIFGIMLTGDKPFKDIVGHERPKRFWILPAIVAIGFLKLTAWALLYPNFALTEFNGLFATITAPVSEMMRFEAVQALRADGGITHIAQLLFSRHVVAFELASILLLMAMIGAILIAKRTYPEEEGEPVLQVEERRIEQAQSVAPMEDILGANRNQELSEGEEKEKVGVS